MWRTKSYYPSTARRVKYILPSTARRVKSYVLYRAKCPDNGTEVNPQRESVWSIDNSSK